jgi:1,4-alpha-glucan branching enzyme
MMDRAADEGAEKSAPMHRDLLVANGRIEFLGHYFMGGIMPKGKTGFRSPLKRRRFAVRLPGADEVAVTGDFTGWSLEGIPLHHDGRDEWYVTLSLLPGEYQYRLRVDGEWRDDPGAAQQILNPYGSRNSVLRIN